MNLMSPLMNDSALCRLATRKATLYNVQYFLFDWSYGVFGTNDFE